MQWTANAPHTTQRFMYSMEKNVTKLSITLCLILLSITPCAPAIFAQGAMGASGQGNMAQTAAKLEKMSAELQLTPAQKQEVKPILMEEAPKLEALKSDTSLRPMQKAMKMHKIGEDTDSKLQPNLTPAQYQKWQQIREQERQQMMEKKGN